MSAIFGCLRFDGGEVSSRDLERMANTLAHRGPDGRKFVVDGAAGLGHCLMRVNQEDQFEVQPLRDREADLTLVADCRIDNREELAAAFDIGAADLRDMPDSALVLRAYKKWGEDCAKHLLGDFAFAVWDGRRKKLLLARDHMGQRGIHYHHGKDFFAFATEIKGLWAVDRVPRVLCEAMIGKRLVMDTGRPPGATFFEEIYGLPGGSTLSLTASGTLALQLYWQPHAGSEHIGRDENYYVETYRNVLQAAVACRLRRLTRPPALCFSGGFDSGGIAALAGPILVAQNRKLIAAASVRAENDNGAVRDARPAVESCRRQMPHLDVRYYVRGNETLFSDLDLSFLTTDMPNGNDYVRRGLYEIAATAGARFVMDGHGGDYTVNYRGPANWGNWLWQGKLRRFAREFRQHMRINGHSAWRTFRRDVVPAIMPLAVRGAWRAARRGFTPLWATRPIADEFVRRLIASGKVDPSGLRGEPSARGRWRAWCMNVLQRQAASAAPGLSVIAAARGLDLSRPFHDKRVVEFGLAIPEDLYVKDGRDRFLARRALIDLLPRAFQTRAGGNDPQDPDFLAMARSAAAAALEDTMGLDRDGRLSRFIDFGKVQRLIATKSVEGDKDSQFRLGYGLETLVLARFVAWFERRNR